MIALFLAIGVGLYHYLQPTNETLASDLTVDVLIQNQRMEPPRIVISKGATLTLQIRTDEEGVVNVEDYNVSAVTALGRAVTIVVPASRSGVFPVTMRSSANPATKVEIGTIEVAAPRRGW